MAYTLQVTIDCRDPHVLAEWWAETLGWSVEPQDQAFIRSMIEQGRATLADTIEHRGALVWREAAAIYHEHTPGGMQSRLYFQAVPEPKTVKNRVHLDVRTHGDDPVPIRQRLIARGATELYAGSQGQHSWITMADPEGNEFCV